MMQAKSTGAAVERAIVYEKVYTTKDGTLVTAQVRENIVSTNCILLLLYFVFELFIESNILFGSCVKTGQNERNFKLKGHITTRKAW